MLKIENLTKIFGKGTINEMVALDGVDFHAEPGDFVTIIGSNGAGKSTLMNSIAGVFPVDSGTIVLNGKDISGLPEHKRARMIGRVFQDPLTGTAFDMTIEENLSIAYNKTRKRGFQAGINKSDRELFKEKLELLGRTIRYPELDAYSATQLLEQTEEHSKAQAEAAWCISRPTAVWPPVCCICGAARSTGMTIG